MESKKMVQQTWYAPPTWYSRGTSFSSPPPLVLAPSRRPVPSSPSVPFSPAGQAPLPSGLSLPLPRPSLHKATPSSVSPLPGFASFLPRNRTASGVSMVFSAKSPPAVSKSTPAVSGGTLKASRPPGYVCPAPFLSAGPSSDVRAAGLSEMLLDRRAVPRQTTTIRSPTSGAVGCPTSTTAVTGTVSTSDVSSNHPQPKDTSCFRPVGVVLKTYQGGVPFSAPANHVQGPGPDTKSALLYCAPPGSRLPWTSAAPGWTPNTSYSAWTRDSKVLLDSKGQVCCYSQALSDNVLQPNYGMYPFSQTYPGKGQEASHVGSLAGAECNMTFQAGQIPSESACSAAQASGRPFQDDRPDVKGTHCVVGMDNMLKEPAYPACKGHGDSGVGCVYAASTTVGSVSPSASVVTVRADDTNLFMTNAAGTTSLTEREFSLHDVKMQLDEATTGLSVPPAPPPSPYNPLCAMPGGADRQPALPTPGEEVKPHPGLDMLSDVSLLVESLKSHGSTGRSRNSLCVASSSSTAISSVECGSYGSEEDAETALCPPQATYVGTLPPDPDSTITLPSAGPTDSTMLPGENMEYTAMNPVHDACYTSTEGLQQQYTLMLPPKKSTKFTKGSGTGLPLLHSSHTSHKSRGAHKLSNNMDSHSDKLTKHGGCRKKTERHDAVTSKANTKGSKKNTSSPKPKGPITKCELALSTQLSKAPHKKVKSQDRKQEPHQQSSAQNRGRGEDSRWTEPDTQSTAVHKTDCESENTAKTFPTRMDPIEGLVKPIPESCSSMHQLGPGGDGPSSAVCKSEEHTHSLLYSALISMAQPEAGTVPGIGQGHSADPPDNLPAGGYDDLCSKVHFDPLVIAEEEVTSTQPHDIILTDNTDVSSEDHRRKKKSNRRRRSHSCVSCYSIPSSDEESLQSSPATGSALSKPASSARGSSKHQCTKSGRKCSARSRPSDKSSTAKTSSSSTEASGTKAQQASGRCLTCKICGRTFATSSNLSRHQHLFHPSLFSPSHHVLELPLTSPRQHRAACASASFAFAASSSLNSNDSTPPPILSPPSRCRLPSPPPTIPLVPCVPPVPHNTPSHSPSNSPPHHTCQLERPVNETSGGKLSAAQDESAPQEASSSRGPRKRWRLHKALQRADHDWQPPKKWEPGSEVRGEERVTRSGRRVGQVKAAALTTPLTTRTTKHKSVTPPPLQPSGKCPLNFRTKKRTRVNSTIPCPYCDSLFSVMSNLKRHTKRQHSDVNVFVCNVCTFKINMRRKLNKHMKQCHSEGFPHPCLDCLARFRSEAELRSHRKEHHRIARFPCQECRLVFYTEEHLGDHMTQYHVTMYVSD